jgi:hypothetical protein
VKVYDEAVATGAAIEAINDDACVALIIPAA